MGFDRRWIRRNEEWHPGLGPQEPVDTKIRVSLIPGTGLGVISCGCRSPETRTQSCEGHPRGHPEVGASGHGGLGLRATEGG